MKANFLVSLLLCVLSGNVTFAQNQGTSEIVDALKESNSLLKKQVASLEKRVNDLEAENARLKQGLGGKTPKSNPKTKDDKIGDSDPFATGSSWIGHLDGRDPQGMPFHQAATAVIVSRRENAFTIRTTITDEVDWIYECVYSKNMYKISKATLTKVPANFQSRPGLTRISDSRITTSLVKGKRILRIAVTRPIGKSGVNAVYTLTPGE